MIDAPTGGVALPVQRTRLRWIGLILGWTSLVAGSSYLFIDYWHVLPSWQRILLPQITLIICLIGSWAAPPGSGTRRCLQFAAAFLMAGALLSFAQLYQTGYDLYEFFFWWGLFIVPWALATRSSELLLLCLINADLATAIYGDIHLMPEPYRDGYPDLRLTQFWGTTIPACINIATLAVAEAWLWQRKRPASWLHWALIALALIPTIFVSVLDIYQDIPRVLFPTIFAAAMLAGIYHYWRTHRIVAAGSCLVALNIIACTAAWRLMLSITDSEMLASLTTALLGAVSFGLSAHWIRRWQEAGSNAPSRDKNSIILTILQAVGGLLTGGFLSGFIVAALIDTTVRPLLLVGIGSVLIIGSAMLSRFGRGLFMQIMTVMLAVAGYVAILAYVWGEMGLGAAVLFALFYACLSYPLNRSNVHCYLFVVIAVLLTHLWYSDIFTGLTVPAVDKAIYHAQLPYLLTTGSAAALILWKAQPDRMRVVSRALETIIILIPILWCILYDIQRGGSNPPLGLAAGTAIYATIVIMAAARNHRPIKGWQGIILALVLILFAYPTQAMLVAAGAVMLARHTVRTPLAMIGAGLAFALGIGLVFLALWPPLWIKSLWLMTAGAVILGLVRFSPSSQQQRAAA